MLTTAFNPLHLSSSVFAVPPLARDDQGELAWEENRKVVRHLESGGIRSILYGGNAVFYHIRLSEYAATLSMLDEITGDETTVVPSIGPAYGFAVDQVEILRNYHFPTAMVLPARDIVDQAGIASGIRRLAELYGKPLVLYLKFDRWLDPEWVAKLERDGVISWIKYAVVLDDPLDDPYLRELCDVFPTDRMVSGIGEQPAIVHLRDFQMTGFTSGCVCVAPRKSMRMLHAIQTGDYENAERLRQFFCPLEDLRNAHSPIRVLHHAVEQAGIADTGPLPPLLSDFEEPLVERIAVASRSLAEKDE